MLTEAPGHGQIERESDFGIGRISGRVDRCDRPDRQGSRAIRRKPLAEEWPRSNHHPVDRWPARRM